ncbi:MAG: hypothetical protein V3V13_03710 [Paracoccaceae bacterium]
MSNPSVTYDAIVSEFAATNQDLIVGNLFGKPCAKFEGKAFVAFFQDCMVFKMTADRCQELIRLKPDSKLFDPSGKGRPMKEWVQVPSKYDADWRDLASEALVLLQLRLSK